jgi:hypothetical protein
LENLSEVLGRERCWCELGLVQTPPAPPPLAPTAARMVQVQLVPSDRVIDARVANVGQGLGKGVFVPPQPGDEVLVLFPGGDPLRAVALSLGLGSAANPNPLGNTGLAILLQHLGGVRLVSADGLPENGIVHGQFLVELLAYLAALEAFITACSLAVIPQAAEIKAAALAFIASTKPPLGPLPSLFAESVAASATSGTAPGVGGPPYATSLHKVTP